LEFFIKTKMSVIENTQNFVKKQLKNAESGHDWFHIERVYKNALLIAKEEVCNLEIVQLAALLHDISDHKYNGGDYEKGATETKSLLLSLGSEPQLADDVSKIVSQISYKGAFVPDIKGSIELSIVRDADRLDAIGAIGIARAFAYGGSKNRALFSPEIPHVLHESKEEYLKNEGHTINHFYEKLFLLKDRMETPTAKEIAESRHQVMVDFVRQFLEEWNVKRSIPN